MALSCLCLLVDKYFYEVRTASFGVALPSPLCWATAWNCWVRAHEDLSRKGLHHSGLVGSIPTWNPCKGESRLWSSTYLLYMCVVQFTLVHHTCACTHAQPISHWMALAPFLKTSRNGGICGFISGILAFVLFCVFETVSRLSSNLLSRGWPDLTDAGVTGLCLHSSWNLSSVSLTCPCDLPLVLLLWLWVLWSEFWNQEVGVLRLCSFHDHSWSFCISC